MSKSKGRNVPPPPAGTPDTTAPITTDERDAHMEFILRHWESLAALSYEGYLAEGKGMMIINAYATAHTDNRDTKSFFTGERNPDFPGYPNTDTERMVRQYDPETHIVIVVYRPNGGTSSYRLEAPRNGLVTPLAAYNKRQSRPTIPSA